MKLESLKVPTIASLPPLDLEDQEDAGFRGKDRAWTALVYLFDHYNRTEKLSYEALGKRIGRKRSQVQRWLSSSTGMNLRSLGLLAEGMDADLLIEVQPRLREQSGQNYCHPREAAKVGMIKLPGTVFHGATATTAVLAPTVRSELETL